ncbi:hypothetical protein Q644_08370 [Brucella intermedia 229E]|uniref:Uncharacterized protein n=1 Tax=Brucella intermedia 229E TaxID=1337887 RepID=U4V1Q7_9HYPH|nr:hypothetical protein Q644_08370 [Brucella intermedia 229E]
MIYRLFATRQRGLVVTIAKAAGFPAFWREYSFEIWRLAVKSRA